MDSPAQCPVGFYRSCGEREAWIKPGLCLMGFGNSLLFARDLLREEIGVSFACSNEKRENRLCQKIPQGQGAGDKPDGQLTLRKKAGVQEWEECACSEDGSDKDSPLWPLARDERGGAVGPPHSCCHSGCHRGGRCCERAAGTVIARCLDWPRQLLLPGLLSLTL